MPNPAVPLGQVALTPIEGFVLSRVDGRTTYDDICRLCGLPAGATWEILRKLHGACLILNPGENPPAPASLLALHDDGSPVDPALLAQGAGLDPQTKARIVRLHRRLATLGSLELLGVGPAADANAVKRAYFAACKDVHPDRFYGQDIGPYRGWLGDIFAALTRAFDKCRK